MADLIFIYNADSGFFNTLTDIAHKIISPSTYSCQLCAITHSPFKMHQAWRDYLASLPHELQFLHKDELQQYPQFVKSPLPLILFKDETGVRVLLSAEQIDRCQDLASLQTAVDQALSA